MKKFNLAYFLLFSAYTNVLWAEDSLNLAIIYDTHEGVLALDYDNQAISWDMKDQFESKATPILLPGNLALRIGMLLAYPEKDDFKKDYQEELKKIAAYEKPDFCNNIKEGIQHIQEEYLTKSESFSQNLSWREAARQFAHAYALMNSCKKEKCNDCVNTIQNYTKKFFNKINLKDWYIYLAPDTPQHLVLFIPRAYARKYKADQKGSVALQRLGFNPSVLTLITPETMVERIAGYRLDEDAVRSIASIFDRQKKYFWNILMTGHGQPTTSKKPPIQLILKRTDGISDPAAIAGLSAREFLKLLDFWLQLPVNSITYNTCFGGGINAQAINALLVLSVTIVKQAKAMGRAIDTSFPVILSLAPSEQIAEVKENARYGLFFDTLNNVFSLPQKPLEKQKALFVKAARAITKEEPLILLPRNVRDKDSVAGAAFSSHVSTFERLIEPDFIIKSDTQGNIVLAGKLATKKRVKTTDQAIEFLFSKEPTRISLETETINKKLIFNMQYPPNFDFLTPTEHVFFENIELSSVFIRNFFAYSFGRHGLPIHASIKTCTAPEPLLSDGDEKLPVTIQDIELYAVHQDLAGVGALFTYRDKWYVFGVENIDNEVVPTKPTVIEIPRDSDEQKALRSRIMQQLELNHSLAILLDAQDKEGILDWLAKPSTYPAVSSKELIDDAFVQLNSLDAAEFNAKISKFDITQKNEILSKAVSAEAFYLAEKLVIAGARIIKDTDFEKTTQILKHMSDDDFKKAIAEFSSAKKNELLVWLMSTSDVDMVSKLLAAGAQIDGNIDFDKLFKFLKDYFYLEARTHVIVSSLNAQLVDKLLERALAEKEYYPAKSIATYWLKKSGNIDIRKLADFLLDDELLTALSAQQRIELLKELLEQKKCFQASMVLKFGLTAGDEFELDDLFNAFKKCYMSDIVPLLSNTQKAGLLAKAKSEGDPFNAVFLQISGQ